MDFLAILSCDTSLYHSQDGTTQLLLCDPDREFGICILTCREYPNFQLNYRTGTAIGLCIMPIHYLNQINLIQSNHKGHEDTIPDIWFLYQGIGTVHSGQNTAQADHAQQWPQLYTHIPYIDQCMSLAIHPTQRVACTGLLQNVFYKSTMMWHSAFKALLFCKIFCLLVRFLLPVPSDAIAEVIGILSMFFKRVKNIQNLVRFRTTLDFDCKYL